MRQMILVAIVTVITGCTENPNRIAIFQQYVDAVNSGAIDEALILCTAEAEFMIPGQLPIRGTNAIRSLLEWDAVLKTQLEFGSIEEHGDTLTVASGFERNEWFSGIGLESIEYGAGLRIIFEGDLIAGIYPSGLTPESALELNSRVGAFMAWAGKHAPDELEQLLPGGYFQYDSQSALAWMRLLDRYNDASLRDP